MELIDEFKDKYQNTTFKIFSSIAQVRKNSFRLHRHTEFELSLIINGSGSYNTEHGVEQIEKGDIFIFSTNEYHCITDIYPSKEKNSMELLNIHFSSLFVLNSDITEKDDFMDIFFNRKKNFKNKLDKNNINYIKATEFFEKIKFECINKKPCYQKIVAALMTEFLILLLRNFDLTDNESHQIKPKIKYIDEINQALAYINKNLCEDITLTQIAKTATLAKTTFISAFSSIIHMTTWDYINIKRIEKAIILLKETNDTILSIAMQCGYNNTANFNRIFKKITGTTPKSYRNKKTDYKPLITTSIHK